MEGDNVDPVSPEGESRQFTEAELEIGRRIYDQMRHFISVPPSMVSQIYRNGLMPKKKSIDGSGTTRMHGSRKYWRDSRATTPNGAIIIHRDDPDPHPGTCDIFIHPPYGLTQQYRGERDTPHIGSTSLARLAAGSTECDFCSIIYRGVYQREFLWRERLVLRKWLDSHPDHDSRLAEETEPWQSHYGDDINEDDVRVNVVFPNGKQPLSVHLVVADASSPERKADEPQTTENIVESLKRDGWNRAIGTLEFYSATDSPSPWFAFGSAPHIQPEVLSQECRRKLQEWLSECVLDHSECEKTWWVPESAPEASEATPALASAATRPRSSLNRLIRRLGRCLAGRDGNRSKIDEVHSSDHYLPARLLKIRWGSGESDPPVASLEETTNPTAIYRYVALSHVWSFTQPLKTTSENYSTHLREVPWYELSFPLRQAIVLILNLQLDLEYIWIDSLCIIQDDHEDKLKELPRMSMIYGRAEIVFAAHGPDLGFDKLALDPIHDIHRPDDPAVYCRAKIPHENMFTAPVDQSSWYGRAWCMQEMIFSRRILHFGGGGEEVFFECNTLATCECGEMEDEMGSDARTLKQQITKALAGAVQATDSPTFLRDLWNVYLTACENYTPRGVTFATDKLPAVSSLMHTFLPYLGKYYAGLWEYNILLNLQWEVSDTMRSDRYSEFVAPSFSWASVSGGVVWYMDTDQVPTNETNSFATVVEVSCETASRDPCTAVSSGHITLRGYVTQMKIEPSKLMWMPDGRVEMTRDGNESAYVTLDSKDDYEKIEPDMVVKCLDLMRDKQGQHGNFVSGLVLLPVDGSNRSQYRRIGFATMLEEHFQDAAIETVTIM
ncbi:heterokaryon incompatibility protein-domain-containing protein [Xylariales sp. PMI_506]|nr:heterokaryon incompatibility protein-domain-containing protein [Xylariales sp. PMI_506]